MAKSSAKVNANSKEPPLVEVKVTNPITYIKNWWNKVVKNDGVDFKLHVHPLTAIAIAAVIATIGFGVGQFVMPEGIHIPFLKFDAISTSTGSTNTPTETPSWKETAYTGTLRKSSETDKYYLVTTSSAEAITLDVPLNFNLEDYVGARIFVSGLYNKSQRVLKVLDAGSTEILPKSPIPLATLTPIPTPTQAATPTATPSPTQSFTPQPSAT